MASVTSIRAITNIRNAAFAKLGQARVKYSSVNIRILDILVREGVVQGFQIEGNDIVVALPNSEIARQKLKNIKVVSKPSKQVYVRLKVLKHVCMKLGVSINSLTLVSTSSGITT